MDVTNAMIDQERDILVYIFQRGAADGLNTVVPYADDEYYKHRPKIAVAAPDQANGVIDLDGFFGLNPVLAPLKPIYDQGELAFLHATGIPHGSRSHFAAQVLVERAATTPSGVSGGWLGRHLSAKTFASAFAAVSISGNVPVSLVAAPSAIAISDLGEFGFDQGIVNIGYPDLLAQLYRADVPFSMAAQASLAAIQELQAAQLDGITPQGGASYPDTPLGKKLKQAGQLIHSNLAVEVICIDSDGWDHHENLPNYLTQSLDELAKSLLAFYTDMGNRMQHVTVLVHSEFGRRVAENGSAGADHGTAGLAYLMGGHVRGGKVYGQWPGLQAPQLDQGEDLAITTDLRNVYHEILSKRLHIPAAQQQFPGFTPTSMEMLA